MPFVAPLNMFQPICYHLTIPLFIGIYNNLKSSLENPKTIFDILRCAFLTFCKMLPLLSLQFMDHLNKDQPPWINPINK
jgi:hypothetical protein